MADYQIPLPHFDGLKAIVIHLIQQLTLTGLLAVLPLTPILSQLDDAPESPGQIIAFQTSLQSIDSALKEIHEIERSDAELCTTFTLQLPDLFDTARDLIPDLPASEQTGSAKILEKLDILTKISRILSQSCQDGGDPLERKSLMGQIRVHFNELKRGYFKEFGVGDQSSTNQPLTPYYQWKNEMRVLLEQVKHHVDKKHWEQLTRLGEAISESCQKPVDENFDDFNQRLNSELLNYDRERMRLYGEILGEYAEEENSPHVIFFADKIEAILLDLP